LKIKEKELVKLRRGQATWNEQEEVKQFQMVSKKLMDSMNFLPQPEESTLLEYEN